MAKDRSGRNILGRVKSKNTYIQNQRHLLAIVRDITEFKENQRRLRDSSERYLELFENSATSSISMILMAISCVLTRW